MSQKIYPSMLYARLANPGTENEFMLVGPEVNNVSDDRVSESESLAETVGRYMLVGTGSIHHTAPRYVEDTET